MNDLQNPELILNLRRQLELQRAKNEAIRKNGLEFYRPWARQHDFHRAAASLDIKWRMLRAGNRTGKSVCNAAETVAWLRGERSWYKHSFEIREKRDGQVITVGHHEGGADHPLVRAGIPPHPVKGVILCQDWDKVDEIWTSERGDSPGKLWKFLPKDAVVSQKRNHSGAIETIEVRSALYKGNSLLRFDTVQSFKTNPGGAESSDWDFIGVDEPCPEKMFKSHARGLVDRRGSFWFNLTPLSEFWINDLFFPQDTGGLPRSNVWADSATIYQNPYLTDEAIHDYESLLNEDEKQCRLLGIPLHLVGLVYKTFSWSKHVLTAPPLGWEDWLRPPKNWPLYIHIDPHPQTPHAVLFCTVDPFGNRYYFFDMFRKCSIEELVKEILDFTRGYRIVRACCDPLAFIEQPVPNSKRNRPYTSMAMDMEDNGLYVEEATKALARGILRVNGELGKEPPCVFFSPHCKRTLWEIQRYCWDDKADRPVDSEDHMMENLYRSELSEPKWSDGVQHCPAIGDEKIISPNFAADEFPSLSVSTL